MPMWFHVYLSRGLERLQWL